MVLWEDLVCYIVIGVTGIAILVVLQRIWTLWRASRMDGAGVIAGTALGSLGGEDDETTTRNWKIDYGDLEIGPLLGQGSIGRVFAGKWRGLLVAVKEVQHNASESEIVAELSLLIRVRHPNLCLFMGLAMPAPDRLALVSEHMARGNLYTVLHDKSLPLDWRRRTLMALDAARAMNYLHCSRPPILHGHLSSINLLVDKELVIKVSDYAVDTIRNRAKRSGVYTQPLWVAPEVLKSTGKKMTKAADVYSFGIVLWEILTRRTPYQGMIRAPAGASGAAAHIKAIADIIAGMRPTLPDRTPAKMASLISRCWATDPAQRPDFQSIVEELSEMEREKPAAHEANNQWLRNQAELEEIAVVRDASSPSAGGRSAAGGDEGPATLEDLLAAPAEKKSWIIAAKELQFEELIGRGSFGEVWLAAWRGKKVAVKKMSHAASAILKGGAILQQNGRQRNLFRDFVREVSLMCSLRHPNTVLFMGACMDPSPPSSPTLALVMEYCSRKDLFGLLQDKSVAIDYNLIIKILRGISEGLLYLHLHRPAIVHRDLKSGNILVDEHWDVKIADYGLTEFKPDGVVSGDGGSDGAALQLGTPFWQSPEAMERGEYSPASDVYALGMIVFELFTREVPFRNLNPHQAALAVIAEDKRPEIPAFVPPKFAALMHACWLRDPRARPSVQEVLATLDILKAEGLPRIELSINTPRVALYRKRTLVFAYPSKDSVIVYKPWGTGEGKKGDWVLVGPGDDVYTCDAAIFLRTYSQVDPARRPHLYRKTGSIFALQMERDFLMETLEGMEHGSAGDWIAQNPVDGEQWPIAAATFQKMYERAPDQVPPPGTMTRAQAQAQAARAAAQQQQSKLGALQEEKEDQADTGLTQRKKH